MRIVTLRSLGFGFPVLILAAVNHLEKEMSWGSGLDGILSGLWFALLAALGAWLMARIRGVERRVQGRAALLDLGRGLLFGIATWMLLWAAWRIPGSERVIAHAFRLNGLVFFVAGLAMSPPAVPRRPAAA